MNILQKHKTRVFVFVCSALFVLSSCKPNMAAFVDEYNRMFIPSEDILWTMENIEKSTMDFDHYEFAPNGYTVSKDTGLFIIGGPRDCDSYIWTLNGKSVSGNQILELRIKIGTPNLSNGATDYKNSLKPDTYALRLQCTNKAGTTKFWDTRLTITP